MNSTSIEKTLGGFNLIRNGRAVGFYVTEREAENVAAANGWVIGEPVADMLTDAEKAHFIARGE